MTRPDQAFDRGAIGELFTLLSTDYVVKPDQLMTLPPLTLNVWPVM